MLSSPSPPVTIIRPVGFAAVLTTPLKVIFKVPLVAPGSTTIVSLADVPVIKSAVPPRHVSGIVKMLPGGAAATLIVTVAVAVPPLPSLAVYVKVSVPAKVLSGA